MEMVAVDASHAAMAMAHVFAKTNIGDRDHIRTFFLNRAQRFLHNAVFGISAARMFILFLRNPKKENGLEPGVVRLSRFIDDFAKRNLKDARHARDWTSLVDLLVDEKRQHEIVRGEIGFANEISYSWRPPQPSWTMDQLSHATRLRGRGLRRKFAT